MSTVGMYRGHRYQRSRIRVVLPHAETNPLLWIAWTPDRSDVIGWADTLRELKTYIDEAISLGGGA